MTAPVRIPFPVVDDMSRHCLLFAGLVSLREEPPPEAPTQQLPRTKTGEDEPV
ncbi:hypothetical protein [Streptomyces sp. AK010]|uniref:hypothetical protein n=1 Tax=Streptomyces sp. AK010 TaxID=2723074 RepID=UPI00161DC90D|nr:hypothetical protein [Streptomyces sp. AK010]MBB6419429.1 hypothetical protein [Streptomyces sp. AK010]